MKLNDIRASFIEFYRQRGHTLIPSASLVPVADASILLIPAGMAPLKRYFMGQEAPPAPTAMSSQKCVRTIDIDQIGFTNRHNTFFEMLGKFSFGDYFKLEAMQYTMEWFTSKDWLGLDKSRLYVTHHEQDEQSRKLWLNELGWPEERLFGLGDADNRWAAGDSGPWGYDTEYFWDFAPDGKPMTKERFVELSESGRIVEIGNDVFMQFQRDANGNDSDLPKKNVDFGGGLERMAMVLQNKDTVFKTDAMDYLIRGFAEVVADASGNSPSDADLFELPASGFNPFWLAADHIRTATFLLGDGVTPGNVGRNYVLRRLIRRIIAQAYRLGVRKPFIMKLSDLVIERLGGHYTELSQNRDKLIVPWISKEEEQFFKVMEVGYKMLSDKVESVKAKGGGVDGAFIFELYDTHGFPADLSLEICRELGVDADKAAFEKEMASQKERARGAAKFEGDMGEQAKEAGNVAFTGYDTTSDEVNIVSADAVDDLRGIASLIAGVKPKKGGDAVPGVKLTTDSTPFYSDSGGQPNDSGWLPLDGQNYPMQSSPVRGVHYVLGTPGVEAGSRVVVAVDIERRNALRRPHTTNHLMLGALKTVLGEHVNQAGSQLGEDEIRFDFSHFQGCTSEELRKIEVLVNRDIIGDHLVRSDSMPLLEAKQMGVTAVFDEKYGAEVRVISVGDGEPDSIEGWVSRELCGGIHLEHTSQAGMFLIVKEESVQSGVRRIYALTGHKAFAYVQGARSAVAWIGGQYKHPMPTPLGDDIQFLKSESIQREELLEAFKELRDKVENSGIEFLSDEKIDSAVKNLEESVKKLPGYLDLQARERLDLQVDELRKKIEEFKLADSSPWIKQLSDFENNYSNRVREWALEFIGKIKDTEKKLKEAHKEAIEARRELSMAELAGKLDENVSQVGGFKTLMVALELENRADVKYIVERYAGSQWQDDYIVFVAANIGGKAALACKVSKSALDKGVTASEMIKLGAGICGGGGGGRPDFAEAGGRDGSKVGDAVDAVKARVGEILG